MPLSNYIPSSKISQPGVCTSSTRPASPYEGQVIYETDTDRTLVWNGSGWVFLSTSSAGDVGLVKIVPTSVVGGSIDSTGTITATANASVLSINGCFTNFCQNYIVMFNTVLTGATNLIVRLRSSGTDDQNAWYGAVTRTQANSASATVTNYNGNTSWVVTDNQSSALQGSLTFYSPALAVTTTANMQSHGLGTTAFQYVGGSYHGQASAFDGFSFYPNGFAITSTTMRIYGYRN